MEENVTVNASALEGNETKFVATPEGMVIAYSNLFLMAIIPIFIGSLRSATKKTGSKQQETEQISKSDAMQFPIYASVVLFSLFLIFKFLPKEWINTVLQFYFLLLGVGAIAKIAVPLLTPLIPNVVPVHSYHLRLTHTDTKVADEEVLDERFSLKEVIAFVPCLGAGIWYIVTKHWLANNLIGLAFSINAIEFLLLNSVQVGCILLGGLFVYDIFWVFGTTVMVSVAKSFDAPIKLVFPQDLIEAGVLGAKHHAMLGLGDIVIPGIFVALMLRYDNSLKRGSRFYFHVTYFAYCSGLLLTIFVMHYFKAAQAGEAPARIRCVAFAFLFQPALLYLVPTCLGFPCLASLVRGDLKSWFFFEASPESKSEEDDTSAATVAAAVAAAPGDKKED